MVHVPSIMAFDAVLYIKKYHLFKAFYPHSRAC